MNAVLKPSITAEEREERRRGIAAARGSVRLEGFVLSAQAERVNERYVDGELTLDEYIAAVKKLD